MIYYAVSILLGLLLLILYYNRLDAIEKRFSFEFVRKNNNVFPRFMDVWTSRKNSDDPDLRKAILITVLIRIVAIVTIWGPFLIYITSEKSG